MSISVLCPGCSAKLNAPDTFAGKKVKCPKCQGVISIPAPVADFEVVEDEPVPPVKKPQPKPIAKLRAKVIVELDEDEDEGDDRPQKNRAKAVDDEDEDDRPLRKKKQKSGISPVIVLGITLIAVLLVGGAGYGIYALFFQKKEKDGGVVSVSPGLSAQPGGLAGIANWPEYRSEQDKFKISMPSKPVVKTNEKLRTRAHTCEDDRFQLRVAVYVLDVPPDSSPEQRQEFEAKLIVKDSDGGKVLNRRTVSFCGQMASETTVSVVEPNETGPHARYHVLIRSLITQNKAYVIGVTSYRGAEGLTEANAIFDTFELLN